MLNTIECDLKSLVQILRGGERKRDNFSIEIRVISIFPLKHT